MSPYFPYQRLTGILCLLTCSTALFSASLLQNNTFAYIGQPTSLNHHTAILGGYRHYNLSTRVYSKSDSDTPFTNPMTANGFNYTAGNPILYRDTSGHDFHNLMLSPEQHDNLFSLLSQREKEPEKFQDYVSDYAKLMDQQPLRIREAIAPLRAILNLPEFNAHQQAVAIWKTSDLISTTQQNGLLISSLETRAGALGAAAGISHDQQARANREAYNNFQKQIANQDPMQKKNLNKEYSKCFSEVSCKVDQFSYGKYLRFNIDQPPSIQPPPPLEENEWVFEIS